MARGQQALLPELKKQYEHGGDLMNGRRKSRRPFDRHKPLHVVFRSDEARGRDSFLLPRNRRKIGELLRTLADKSQITIYETAISSNHIHALILAPDRRALQRFFRTLAGGVAMAVTGARKGSALLKSFWRSRVYSRIVEWGRAFRAVRRYIVQNTLEALGIIPYQPRGRKRVPQFPQKAWKYPP